MPVTGCTGYSSPSSFTRAGHAYTLEVLQLMTDSPSARASTGHILCLGMKHSKKGREDLRVSLLKKSMRTSAAEPDANPGPSLRNRAITAIKNLVSESIA